MSCFLHCSKTCWTKANWCSALSGSVGSNWASSLTASAPMRLILATLHSGSKPPSGAPAEFLPPPDFSTRTRRAVSRGRWKLATVFHTP